MAQKVLPVGTDLEEIPSIRDLAADVDVAMAAIGTTADAPDTAVNEDATPRTGVSLWKGAKNFLRWIYMSVGLLADAPASNTVPEDVTARSGISLWKAIKNILALMNAKLPAALGQGTMAQSLTTVPASDYYSGNGLSVPVTLTVTNGAYTAQDVVGGAISLANAVRANGKESVLNSVVLVGMTSAIAFELWLLNADLATPVADNGAFALVAADLPKVLHVVSLGGGEQYQAGAGGIYVASYGAINKQVKAGAATRTLIAYLKHTTTTSPGTTTLYLTCNFEYIS